MTNRNNVGDTSRVGPDKMRQRRLLRSIVAMLGVLALPMWAAGEEAYRLGPLDTLRIRVHEWRAARDEIYEWSAIKDDYTVGASGTLSLPVAGEVNAFGLTVTELAATIGVRLKERVGMIEAPDTTVEVVKYRPFYIIGHVDKPGEYPYRPGLSVLQALSVAGGLQRVSDMGLFRLERDSIAASGDLSVIASETAALLARKSRLQAEFKSLPDIQFVSELLQQEASPSVSLLMEQEKLIFVSRRNGLQTQIDALEQLKVYLNSEVESLDAQADKEDVQIKLVQKELDSVSTLVDKGLTSAPRQLLLQRTIAQIEGERLRLNTSATKARQDLSRTEIAILELRNKWTNEITTELRQTDSKLEELSRRAATSNKLLYEAQITAPQFIAERARSGEKQPILKIVRKIDGQPVETVVSESASVAPGDTIKVELPSPEHVAGDSPTISPAVSSYRGALSPRADSKASPSQTTSAESTSQPSSGTQAGARLRTAAPAPASKLADKVDTSHAGMTPRTAQQGEVANEKNAKR